MDPTPSTSKQTPFILSSHDPEFAEKLKMCLESLSEESAHDSDHSESDDLEIFSSHSTASESDGESDTELEIANVPPVPEVEEETVYVGKNNYSWTSSEPKKRKRIPQKNIITQVPGLRGRAKTLGDNPKAIEVWDLLFDETIVSEIVLWTNIKIIEMRSRLDDQSKVDYIDTDQIEMRALFGLLLFTSIFKSGRETVESLFSTTTKGRPIFSGNNVDQTFSDIDNMSSL